MSKLSKENAERALAVVNSKRHGNEVYVFSDGEYFASKKIANAKVSVKGSYTVVPKAEIKRIAEGKEAKSEDKSQPAKKEDAPKKEDTSKKKESDTESKK